MEQSVLSSPQELQNDFVRLTTHKRPACIVEFDVEALEPLTEKALKDAAKVVSKKVTLPGFRKGKAPEALIRKNFPKEVDEELKQAIADRCVHECLKLAPIQLLRGAKITYQMKSHSTRGALLQIFVETEPTVPHVDPARLQLPAIKRPEVNDEKVEETIRQALLFFASWQPVEDRPIQVGDFVNLNVEITESETPLPLFTDTRFEVKEKSMAKWMLDLVLGKKKGDSVDGISVPDADAPEEEKAGLTEKKVRLTILTVETAALPELDEKLLRQLGVSSVEEMREKITSLLNRQADEHVVEEGRKLASEFLLKENPFELPTTLIEKETEFRFRQLWADPAFREYWEGLGSEEKNKIIRTVKEQSEKAVRLFYLSKQITTDASIKISAEDLPLTNPTPLEILLDPQQDAYRGNSEVGHAEAYSRLVLQKAQDFIVRNATRP